MTDNAVLTQKLTDATPLDGKILHNPDVAHLFIHHNKVTTSRLVPGLNVETDPFEDGIKVDLSVDEGVKLQKPVQVCFGMIPETGMQKIVLDIRIKKNASLDLVAHCAFPNAKDIQHLMDAVITVEEGASYSYFERHVHGPEGGIKVVPNSKITVHKDASFKTEFELLSGRVGSIDIDLDAEGKEYSTIEMNARINGTGNDLIKIKENALLSGEGARSVLITRVAARGNAVAEVFNKVIATAAGARGHVDCKEIIQGRGRAAATPIVDVRHPKAHVTHEAAIGSVDNKQLETLMARGLSEEQAEELIIKGLLS